MKKGDEVEVVREIPGYPPIGARGTLLLIDPKDKKFPYYVNFTDETIWRAFRVNEIKAVKK